MSVISFWNAMDKCSGQTSSALAIATYMAIEHNFRILLIDGSFNDKTMEKAFWKKRENKALEELTAGKIDISSGAEGLVSAIASNKVTPEIVTNYTKIVFKNRLDVLPGLKTESIAEHEKSMMLYKNLVITANKYYDMVFIDLPKGMSRPSSEAILKNSDIIMYTLPLNLTNIDKFNELKAKKNPYVSTIKTLPTLTRSDDSSSYNVKNTARYIKEKSAIVSVPYNVRFMEAVNEAKLGSFMTSSKLSKSALTANGGFFQAMNEDCQIIINRIKEVNQMTKVKK